MKPNLQHVDINKVLERAVSISFDEAEKLREELKKVKQHNRDMMNVLSDLEWIEDVLNPNACPWCGYQKHKGHDVGCRLDKVLHGVV